MNVLAPCGASTEIPCEIKLKARPRLTGTGSAEVIQVIKTVTRTGNGTREDMNRFLTQYWSLDGELLAQFDPQFDNLTKDA